MAHVRECFAAGTVVFTQHARIEMAEEAILVEEIEEAISNAVLIENYPGHRRGACCLLSGQTTNQRAIHLVCTTSGPGVIVITVYEPAQPKWIDRFTRWRTT